MSPPARQSVVRISKETGIHICTLYAWHKGWRPAGEVVPASQKDPEAWSAGAVSSPLKAMVMAVMVATAARAVDATCRTA